MSVRFARTAFTSAARRSVKTTLSSSSRPSWRTASTSSHESTKSSDKPWIIGSLLIFGPAFLYLISPSARKSHHLEHKEKHDFPALLHDEHSKVKQENTPEPELVKDDEGTVADVAASVALAKSADVPNDAQPAEEHAALKSEAENDAPKVVEEEPASVPSENAGEEKAETTKEKDRELPKSPTNMGEARKAAVEHTPPKEVAESKN